MFSLPQVMLRPLNKSKYKSGHQTQLFLIFAWKQPHRGPSHTEFTQPYHSDIPALIITGDIEVARLTEINASNYQVLYKPVSVKLRAFLLSIKLV